MSSLKLIVAGVDSSSIIRVEPLCSYEIVVLVQTQLLKRTAWSYWTPHLFGQKQEGETICAFLRYGRCYRNHQCRKWRMHHRVPSNWMTPVTLTMNFVQTGVIFLLPHFLALRLCIVPWEVWSSSQSIDHWSICTIDVTNDMVIQCYTHHAWHHHLLWHWHISSHSEKNKWTSNRYIIQGWK